MRFVMVWFSFYYVVIIVNIYCLLLGRYFRNIVVFKIKFFLLLNLISDIKNFSEV